MISGSFGNSCGEALSVINEERRKSLYGDSHCTTASVDLQAFEETSFTELPGTSLKGHRRKGAISLPPHNSSARDKLAPSAVSCKLQ